MKKSRHESLPIYLLNWSPEHVITDYSPSVDGMLKINNDHMGFYRVNHDKAMWTDISEQLLTNHTVRQFSSSLL